MFCYEVHVETTNSTNKAFKTGGKYHDCIDGIVYVFANDVHEAAKQIPEATLVRLMGRAFSNGEQ